MSFVVLPQNQIATISEITLFAENGERDKTCDPIDDASGILKGATKQYAFRPQHSTLFAKGTKLFLQLHHAKTQLFTKNLLPLSPMQLASLSYKTSNDTGKETSSLFKPSTADSQRRDPNQSRPSLTPNQYNAHNRESHGQERAHPASSQQITQKNHTSANRLTPSRQQKGEESKNGTLSLTTRRWTKEETKEWWEQRYHQREGRGDGEKKEHHGKQNEEDQKKLALSKTNSTTQYHSSQRSNGETSAHCIKKPILSTPAVGVFALYYILTKIGIFSDGTSNFAYRNEIELLDTETTEVHKKRLEQLKEAIKKEKETASWGIAVKVFSWIASLFGIIAGAVLIATGVGAVAGAMLIAGGLIQISNQIMELTGGWKKIVELLPGDDAEKKRAIISWMQIGIAVLCLILSGVGIIWGGYAHFGEAMSVATAMIGGIFSMGYGASTIGQGISGFMYKDRLSNIKQSELELARLKHKRKDLMEKVEWGIDRLEQLFEDLSRSLAFEEELFHADQLINRR